DQKEIFGASADRLPYVECSPGGQRSTRAPACEEAGVRVYPTWIINGRSYEGVLSTPQLAGLSDFRASP
ncbi:MAG: vitamin K epoxide reductase family protein, partial [Candidatus Binatia bacterium]